MKHLLKILIAAVLTTALIQTQSTAQTLRLTLDEVINLAKDQSLSGILAKHTFRASYWSYRSYKAEFLPSLVFVSSLPDFTRAMRAVQQGDGTYLYRQDFSNQVSAALNIEQNIPLTGGSLSVGSNLSRLDVLGQNGYVQYLSTPINVAYQQSLFGLNTLKWSKKIEPKRYEQARQTYLSSMENVSLTAIRYFFNLATAQQSVASADFNRANNDSLYRMARGRYNIGTIGENEMLQSELNFMNATATLNDALLSLESAKNRLRSFLGFSESVDIEIVVPNELPFVSTNVDRIMYLAKQNNPQMLANEIQLIEAQQAVAQAKASRGFNANLSLQFGLDQSSGNSQMSGNIASAYKSPGDMERVSLSLRIPILDWGKGKGQVKMAQSREELTKVTVQQSVIDFEQDVILQVNRFNKQAEQLRIVAKADTIAKNRYNVSMQRYKIDKIDITEMNNAQNDRDNAAIRYVDALFNYWTYYYTLRQLTLYDLFHDKPLEADYDKLVE
jgi:outer membrane protein TolC